MTPETGRMRWRKARQSGGTNGNCVEVANTLDAVRDSKNPAGPSLTGDVPQLLVSVRSGQLDR